MVVSSQLTAVSLTRVEWVKDCFRMSWTKKGVEKGAREERIWPTSKNEGLGMLFIKVG